MPTEFQFCAGSALFGVGCHVNQSPALNPPPHTHAAKILNNPSIKINFYAKDLTFIVGILCEPCRKNVSHGRLEMAKLTNSKAPIC